MCECFYFNQSLLNDWTIHLHKVVKLLCSFTFLCSVDVITGAALDLVGKLDWHSGMEEKECQNKVNDTTFSDIIRGIMVTNWLTVVDKPSKH